MAGRNLPSPLENTRHQLLLGGDAFIGRHRQQQQGGDMLRDVSKAHRRTLALPLAEYQTRYPDRNEAMSQAYQSGAYTMAEIARHFGVHYMTVSRAVRMHETAT